MPPKWYAVREGREPGVYRSWDECKDQVHRYSGAEFKSFQSPQDAARFFLDDKGNSGSGGGNYNGGNSGGGSK